MNKVTLRVPLPPAQRAMLPDRGTWVREIREMASALRSVFFMTAFSVCLACSGCSHKEEPSPPPDGSSVPVRTAQQDISSLELEIASLRTENAELKKALEGMGMLRDRLHELEQGKGRPRDGAARANVEAREPNRSPVMPAAEVAQAIRRFRNPASPQMRLETVRSLRGVSARRSPAVLQVVREALSDADPNVRRTAVEILEGQTSPEILPVVSMALTNEDEVTRVRALASLKRINDPKVVDVLAQAFEDESWQVQTAAMEMVEDLADPLQINALQRGLSASQKDIRSTAVTILTQRSDPPAVDVLIEGLKNEDAEFKAEVRDAVFGLLGREFETYEAAKTWWTANQYRFDDQLAILSEEE